MRRKWLSLLLLNVLLAAFLAALALIFSSSSLVCGEMLSSRKARLSRPMIALIGVLISWLICERNWDFARLAFWASLAEAMARFFSLWL